MGNLEQSTTIDPSDEKEVFLRHVLDIHEKLLDTLDYDEMNQFALNEKELESYLTVQINKIINSEEKEYPEDYQKELASAVVNEVVGFGPIEPLLKDPAVTDIFVNSPKKIYIEKKGKVERSPISFFNDEHVFRLVQRIASKTGKHLDLSTPYLDAQLEDGSRLHAIIPPCAIEGVKLSIRKFSFNKLYIGKLVESDCLTDRMAKLLQIAVRSRFNLVVCGGTGSGKTTLLNSLLDSIREKERVITIEDTPELEPVHSHVIRLVTRPPNSEGKGEVNQEHLMINALRMRPDRVILGELRGSEAFNLLHAMNTGQDGSMATLHASGTEEVLARLLNMILMARYSLSVESIRQQIAGALDLVVYVSRLVNGARRVMCISQISSNPEGGIKVDELFRYDIQTINERDLEGCFEQSHPIFSPRIINKLIAAGQLEEFLELFSDIEKTGE